MNFNEFEDEAKIDFGTMSTWQRRGRISAYFRQLFLLILMKLHATVMLVKF